MELWGGFECTVNRVGDRFRDQAVMTGHHDRLDDFARAADLGIKALRFPVLWERVAPDTIDHADWRWSDAGLAEVARLGMRPIIGLLHHGSGPRHTSLIADDFVPKFAGYARAVAERYPHVIDWTPINEPLTTARFSTLYGTWYPHARDERSFWLAMLNQAEATIAAMAAIRTVVPGARLIQTDDLGETFASPPLEGVAAYYNVRRWLGWDLIVGTVRAGHPLWAEAEALGFGDRLRAIADAPCPPDIVGIDHYTTSDRLLRPVAPDLAGNGPGYDDLAAVRVLDPAGGGLIAALRQAWERYGIPLAVTECHLGCTREEQLRWVRRSWDATVAARAEGIDVRALTAWALAGNVDWVNLITVEAGVYEPGAFDVSGPAPRPTAVAKLLSALGHGTECPAILDTLARQPGWWERAMRLGAPPLDCPPQDRRDAIAASVNGPPILIVGSGHVAHAIAGACRLRRLQHMLVDHGEIVSGDRRAVDQLLDRAQPWTVIATEPSSAGVGGPGGAWAAATETLAVACAKRDLGFALVACDAVQAQRLPLARPGVLEVRCGVLFSPFDGDNLAMTIERDLRAGKRVFASADQSCHPTYLPDFVRVLLDLLIDGESGSWHLSHGEPVSPFDFARRIAGGFGLDQKAVVIAPSVDGPSHACLAGPENGARGALLPQLDDAILRHLAERRLALAGFEPANSPAVARRAQSEPATAAA